MPKLKTLWLQKYNGPTVAADHGRLHMYTEIMPRPKADTAATLLRIASVFDSPLYDKRKALIANKKPTKISRAQPPS